MKAALGARGSSCTCKWAERERILSYYVAWPWTPQAGQVAPPWLGVAARARDSERASAARSRQRFRYTRAFLVGSLGSLVSKPLLLRVLHQVSLLGLKSTLEDMEPASVL